MPHGHPDYGGAAPLATVYTLQDMAELAARLGSIDTFDRRGNVIFMDGFESGIAQWQKDMSVGGSIDWDSSYAKAGGFSCKLITDTDRSDYATIRKYIGPSVLSNIGFEGSFSWKQHWRDLTFFIELYDGSHVYQMGIRYDDVNNKLQAWIPPGDYQDIPDGSHKRPDAPYKFDTLKFVADLTTGKYKRLLLNSQVFDLSALSYYKDESEDTPRMSGEITLRTSTTAAAIAYIDNVILTQNEP